MSEYIRQDACPQALTYNSNPEYNLPDFNILNYTEEFREYTGVTVYPIMVDIRDDKIEDDERVDDCNKGDLKGKAEDMRTEATAALAENTDDTRFEGQESNTDGTFRNPNNANKICCNGVVMFSADSTTRLNMYGTNLLSKEYKVKRTYGTCESGGTTERKYLKEDHENDKGGRCFKSTVHETRKNVKDYGKSEQTRSGETCQTNLGEGQTTCRKKRGAEDVQVDGVDTTTCTTEADAETVIIPNNVNAEDLAEIVGIHESDVLGFLNAPISQGAEDPLTPNQKAQIRNQFTANAEGQRIEFFTQNDCTIEKTPFDHRECTFALYSSTCRSVNSYECKTTESNTDYLVYEASTSRDNIDTDKIVTDVYVTSSTGNTTTREEKEGSAVVPSPFAGSARYFDEITGGCCNGGIGELGVLFVADKCGESPDTGGTGCAGGEVCEEGILFPAVKTSWGDNVTQKFRCDRDEFGDNGEFLLYHKAEDGSYEAGKPSIQFAFETDYTEAKREVKGGSGSEGNEESDFQDSDFEDPTPETLQDREKEESAPPQQPEIQNPDPFIPIEPDFPIPVFAAGCSAENVRDSGDPPPPRPESAVVRVADLSGRVEWESESHTVYGAIGDEMTEGSTSGIQFVAEESKTIPIWSPTACNIGDINLPYHSINTTNMLGEEASAEAGFGVYPMQVTDSIKYVRTSSEYTYTYFDNITEKHQVGNPPSEYTCYIDVIETETDTSYYYEVDDGNEKVTTNSPPVFGQEVGFWTPDTGSVTHLTTERYTMDDPIFDPDDPNEMNKVHTFRQMTITNWLTTDTDGPMIDGNEFRMFALTSVSHTTHSLWLLPKTFEKSSSYSRKRKAKYKKTDRFLMGRGPCAYKPTSVSYCKRTAETVLAATSKTGTDCDRDIIWNRCIDGWDTWTYSSSWTFRSVVTTGWSATSTELIENTCDCCMIVKYMVVNENMSSSETGYTIESVDSRTTFAQYPFVGSIRRIEPLLISASTGKVGYQSIDYSYKGDAKDIEYDTLGFHAYEHQVLSDFGYAREAKLLGGVDGLVYQTYELGGDNRCEDVCRGQKYTFEDTVYECSQQFAEFVYVYLEDVKRELGEDSTISVRSADLAYLIGGNPASPICSEDNEYDDPYFWNWQDECGNFPDLSIPVDKFGNGFKYKGGGSDGFGGGGGDFGGGDGGGDCGPFYDGMIKAWNYGVEVGTSVGEKIDTLFIQEECGGGGEFATQVTPLIGDEGVSPMQQERECFSGLFHDPVIVGTMDDVTFYEGAWGLVNFDNKTTTAEDVTVRHSSSIPVALLYGGENRQFVSKYYGGTKNTIFYENGEWLVSYSARSVSDIEVQENDLLVPVYDTNEYTGTRKLEEYKREADIISLIQPEWQVKHSTAEYRADPWNGAGVYGGSYPDLCSDCSATTEIGAGLMRRTPRGITCPDASELSNCCPPHCDTSELGRVLAQKGTNNLEIDVFSNGGEINTYSGGGKDKSYSILFPKFGNSYEGRVNVTYYNGTRSSSSVHLGRPGDFIELDTCDAFAACAETIYEAVWSGSADRVENILFQTLNFPADAISAHINATKQRLKVTDIT